MLAAAQFACDGEPRAAIALLRRAKALRPDADEIDDWLEFVEADMAEEFHVMRTPEEAARQLAPVWNNVLEIGNPNDPGLASRLTTTFPGRELPSLAERYQQMARVAFDAREYTKCWLGSQIALELLDGFKGDPVTVNFLAESAAMSGRVCLATGKTGEAIQWVAKAGEYVGLAKDHRGDTTFRLARDLVDAGEILAVAQFLMRARPGLSRMEPTVDVWLFLASRGLPPTIR
jgi:hypothetical protein